MFAAVVIALMAIIDNVLYFLTGLNPGDVEGMEERIRNTRVLKEQKEAFRDLCKAVAQELRQRDPSLQRREGIYKLLDGSRTSSNYDTLSRGQVLSRMGSGASEKDTDFQASLHALFAL